MPREQPDHDARLAHRASSPRWRRATVACVVLGVVVSACGGSDDDADDHDTPGVYEAVIRSVAPGDAGTMPKIVFVETSPGTKLSLEDQAAVVKTFDDDTTVRFIDQRNEAVDDSQPQSRVRRDGVLLKMSPAQITDTGVSVKTTRYVTRDDQRTMCLELEETAKVWVVSSSRPC